jgi:hypothetical protein
LLRSGVSASLRAGRDCGGSSETCGAKEGVLSEQWQRPELYDSFYPKPLKQAAERRTAAVAAAGGAAFRFLISANSFPPGAVG